MFAVPMTKSQYQQWNPSITDTIENQHRLTSFPGLARSSLAARKIRAEFRAASDEHLTASLGVPGRRGLRKLSHAVRWQGPAVSAILGLLKLSYIVTFLIKTVQLCTIYYPHIFFVSVKP